jgi:hypothetical protein
LIQHQQNFVNQFQSVAGYHDLLPCAVIVFKAKTFLLTTATATLQRSLKLEIGHNTEVSSSELIRIIRTLTRRNKENAYLAHKKIFWLISLKQLKYKVNTTPVTILANYGSAR